MRPGDVRKDGTRGRELDEDEKVLVSGVIAAIVIGGIALYKKLSKPAPTPPQSP